MALITSFAELIVLVDIEVVDFHELFLFGLE